MTHTISNKHLTIEKVNEIISKGLKLELSPESEAAIVKCRKFLDSKMEDIGRPVYGVTTGFGSRCNITIPAEVTSIGWCAFAECGGLTDVTILGSMIKIGEGAFEECVSIDKVCYRGSKDDKANIIFGDGNDYLLNATWYYNACTDGHTYSNYYDSLCNKCSWSRGDREPNALNLLEMQQNILGVTDFAYGHFDINFDKIVDSVDISIVQIFILGL